MSRDTRVWSWVGALAVTASGATVALAVTEPPLHPDRSWFSLPVLLVLLVAAERLRVRIRVGTEVDAVNLVEAVLAPLLFGFPGTVVVATVILAQVIAAAIRRGDLVKNAFNVSQWTLGAACGAVTYGALSSGDALSAHNLIALVVALAAVGLVNNASLVVVLSFARGDALADVVTDLKPVMLPAWAGGWALNSLIGLLYVVAYAGHPAAVLLFAVPLAALHLAYRGFATVRADQQRLAGLHRAAQTLATPVDPRDAVDGFLAEVARCFEARAAALILRGEVGREVHLLDREDADRYTVVAQDGDAATLEGVLAALPAPVRAGVRDRHPISAALRDAGWHDCLAAPLIDDGRLVGALAVFDQAGIEGAGQGELAVLEALARETAGVFVKGRLLSSVLEERRKLADIVGTTSDGILTLDADGRVVNWNPALEGLTGLATADVLAHTDVLLRLRPRTIDGEPVDLAGWRRGARLPVDLRVTATDGAERRLSCSYSRVLGDDGSPQALVVIARDVTPREEIAALREEYGRLAEAQEAQRIVVEQLQDAVVPTLPEVAGTDLAVEYVPSDPSAPTGGDLYDWYVLPDGTLHLAVVDVLGHGVAATKAALTVVHTLRVVAGTGTALRDIVGTADRLLSAQDRDLVATVVVARYHPDTGELRIASGGHPPALVVSSTGEVDQIAASGIAIGWPGAGSDEAVRLTLAPGDTLVLYTDGLIEARKDILTGMDDLVRHAREVASLPAGDMARALVARALAGAGRRDDTLALVLRRLPATLPRLEHSLAPTAQGVTEARRALVDWLATMSVSSPDAGLVAAELLANAVRVARTRVTLVAELRADRLRVLVSDDGPGDRRLAERGVDLPHAESTGGRGLFLVRALSAGVEVTSTAEGSIVACDIGVVPQPRPSGRRRVPAS